jgi:hypothetical protein
MRRLGRWRNQYLGLKRELRANRPEPRPEFAEPIVERLQGRRTARPAPTRFAFAGGLTAVLLAALASLGGFGYASSTLREAAGEVTDTLASGPDAVQNSPGSDQYRPGKGCGDNNHIHERNEQCKMKINDVSLREGNSGTTMAVFTVSLSDFAIDQVTAAYSTSSGTATSGSDFLPAAGTLVVAPGTTATTVSVPVLGDTVREKNEKFFVNLSSPSANAIIADGQGVGTIINDD